MNFNAFCRDIYATKQERLLLICHLAAFRASKTIEDLTMLKTYQCVECHSLTEVKDSAHEDPDTYIECECGELMKPLEINEINCTSLTTEGEA